MKINQFPLMFYTVVDIFTNVIILRTHSGILYWGSFISNKTKINIDKQFVNNELITFKKEWQMINKSVI